MDRKLSLQLESLEVSSFQTAEGIGRAGTVLAHEDHEMCPFSKTDSCPDTILTCG